MRVAREVWLADLRAHRVQVDAWTAPRLRRRARGAKHPVDDFLFDYYPISPGKLRVWHPGADHDLAALPRDARHFPSSTYGFEGDTIRVNDGWLTANAARIRTTLEYLDAVSARAVTAGCSALHEWAMVLDASEVRHDAFPLRVGRQQVRETVELIGLRCTHFDAFRFFTEAARPMNPLQLTRADQINNDQPSCLHVNMDLYKHAHTLAPLVGSNVVRDAFALARDIRLVDMQVAPYDLTTLGVVPIAIETTEGRREFAAAQLRFATRASELRQRLLRLAAPALR